MIHPPMPHTPPLPALLTGLCLCSCSSISFQEKKPHSTRDKRWTGRAPRRDQTQWGMNVWPLGPSFQKACSQNLLKPAFIFYDTETTPRPPAAAATVKIRGAHAWHLSTRMQMAWYMRSASSVLEVSKPTRSSPAEIHTIRAWVAAAATATAGKNK